MNNPSEDQRIKPLPSPPLPSVLPTGITLQPGEDVLRQPPTAQPWRPFHGAFFGAAVGLLCGATVGAAFCRFAGLTDFLWEGAFFGALIGPFGGSAIGVLERRARGELARPDIATFICAGYAILPGLIVLFVGSGGVTGKLTGFMLLGIAAAAPMSALLIGGVLDRAYEAWRNKARGAAVGFGSLGTFVCMGLLAVLLMVPTSPEPTEMASMMRRLVLQELTKDPEVQDARIHEISLTRQGRKTYTGFVDVTLSGQRERLILDVCYENEFVRWTLKGLND